MNNADKAVEMASIGILEERFREQMSKANREKVYSVYVNATPTPDDALDAVKVVEQVLKEHCVATAAFHANEAARFKLALMAVKGEV